MEDWLAGLGIVLLLFVALWLYRRSNMNGIYALTIPSRKVVYVAVHDVPLTTGGVQSVVIFIDSNRLDSKETNILTLPQTIEKLRGDNDIAVKTSNSSWGGHYDGKKSKLGNLSCKLVSSDLELTESEPGSFAKLFRSPLPTVKLTKVPDATVGLVRA